MTTQEKSKGYENPLLPHRRMREMFTAMLRLRDHEPSRRWPAGDFSIAVGLGMRDAEASRILTPERKLQHAVDLALGSPVSAALPVATNQRVPPAARPLEYLYFALGTAASNVPTVVLLSADRLSGSRWQRLLDDLAALSCPVLLATLPGKRTGLAELALRRDIPGIPVDFADPIALYRVAGESLVRLRAGGGPVLLEGIRVPGSSDAFALLRRQLLARGAATERWLSSRESRQPHGTAKPEESGTPGEQVH